MEYDLLIVGGGAAGLFLAAQAPGLRTLILEKRERPARKLLITGKGRCNLTNDCETDTFMRNIMRGGRFLHSAIAAFGPRDTMRFFEEQGVPLKVERGGRVFPKSDRAMDVVDALVRAARAAGADIRHGAAARRLILSDSGAAQGVETVQGAVFRARHVAVATGGMSYPATGSSGDGYAIARQAGHMVETPLPALVSISTRGTAAGQLAGLSLRNVALSLCDAEKPKKPVFREIGEALFTHTGLSGPLALTASSMMDAARPRDYTLALDLKPGLDREQLDRRILRDFGGMSNRDLCNALDALLPRALVPVIIGQSGVDPRQKIHEVTREQRAALCAAIKAFPLPVESLGPMDEAIITRGGVRLREIDPRTMRSRICGGLAFAGEVLDIDALTGGFNLQLAFSTAYCAAKAIKEGTA